MSLTKAQHAVLTALAGGDRLAIVKTPTGEPIGLLSVSGRWVPAKTALGLIRQGWVDESHLPLFGPGGRITEKGLAALDRANERTPPAPQAAS